MNQAGTDPDKRQTMYHPGPEWPPEKTGRGAKDLAILGLLGALGVVIFLLFHGDLHSTPSGPAPQAGTGAAPIPEMATVLVKGGCFRMGADEGEEDVKPAHEVCVSDFRIGTHEVTQGEWRRVMGSNPSAYADCGDDCPVEKVSWNDVQEYIRKVNAMTGKGYRLPTEAEWEYACRSGGRNEQHCGGDNLDLVAWHKGNSGDQTHPVGKKQPNGLGIHDMTGNVSEYVQDWYDNYGAGRQQDPAGPASSSSACRAGRGGGPVGGPVTYRSTSRGCYPPDMPSSTRGFRLAAPAT